MSADASATVATAPLLAISGISKRFAGVQALRDVSLELEAARTLAVVGENGAGKSTLIKILAGAIEPDEGSIAIDGEQVELHTPRAAELLRIVTVHQELEVFPGLSVAENLFLGDYPKVRGVIGWRRLRAEARKLLDELGIELPVDARLAALSTAEKYLVEVARALRQRPRLLILDEPTAVLGPHEADRLLGYIENLAERGVAVIFVSHRLNEVFRIAHRYVVLRDGVLTASGDIRDTTEEELVTKMVGRSVPPTAASTTTGPTGDEALRVEGLRRAGVLDGVSFTVRAGEIVGLAGLEGSGRTEAARAIFGADPVDDGRVYVHGKELRLGSVRRSIRAGIGLVPEERRSQGLLTGLTGDANVSLVRMAAHGEWVVRRSRDRSRTHQHVQQLGIRGRVTGTPVRYLSGGNQQKIVLAKWLEAGVSVLILDEPTRGVDVGSKAQIHDLIREVCASGVAVIVISSELPEVLALSDRVLVMREGRIAGELSRQEANEEAVMTYAVGAGR